MEFDFSRYSKIVANDLSLNGSISSALGGLSQWSSSSSDIYFNDGNVGIGTTSPGSKLHIHDNTLPSIRLSRDDNSHNGFQIYSTSSAAYVSTKEDQPLHFETNLSTRMTILANGNVGIGTTSPNRRFVIYQDIYPTLQIINSASSGTGANNGLEIFQGGNSTVITNRENGSMTFKTNDTSRMRILANGRIGLGTDNPAYFLDVIAINHRTTHTFSRYRGFSSFHAFQASTSSTTMTDFGMRCDSNVAATSYQAFSDKRIKNNITEMNDDTSLQKLRLLKPCTYEYKDKITRGTSIVEGFIAQEVKEVLPYAVNNILQDIPNIYKMGSYDIDASNNKVITINDYDTANLELDASGNVFPKLKVILEDNTVEYVTISSVISPSSIVIESENDIPTGEIFIYGQNVDNFCSLDKDRIFTVTTSALQEIDRQLQAEKTKVATLETQLADVLQRLSNAGI